MAACLLQAASISGCAQSIVLAPSGQPMVAAEPFSVRAAVPDGTGGWTAGAGKTTFPIGTYLVYRTPATTQPVH